MFINFEILESFKEIIFIKKGQGWSVKEEDQQEIIKLLWFIFVRRRTDVISH